MVCLHITCTLLLAAQPAVPTLHTLPDLPTVPAVPTLSVNFQHWFGSVNVAIPGMFSAED